MMDKRRDKRYNHYPGYRSERGNLTKTIGTKIHPIDLERCEGIAKMFGWTKSEYVLRAISFFNASILTFIIDHPEYVIDEKCPEIIPGGLLSRYKLLRDSLLDKKEQSSNEQKDDISDER